MTDDMNPTAAPVDPAATPAEETTEEAPMVMEPMVTPGEEAPAEEAPVAPETPAE